MTILAITHFPTAVIVVISLAAGAVIALSGVGIVNILSHQNELHRVRGEFDND